MTTTPRKPAQAEKIDPTPATGHVSDLAPLGSNSVAGNSVGGRQPDEPIPESIDPTVNNDGTPQPDKTE